MSRPPVSGEPRTAYIRARQFYNERNLPQPYYDLLDAAIAEASTGAALDAERLAEAMDNLFEKRWGPSKLPKGSTTIGGAYAEQIAAEYARLAEQSDV